MACPGALDELRNQITGLGERLRIPGLGERLLITGLGEGLVACFLGIDLEGISGLGERLREAYDIDPEACLLSIDLEGITGLGEGLLACLIRVDLPSITGLLACLVGLRPNRAANGTAGMALQDQITRA